MERSRYIQWTVSAKDAAVPNDLGYLVRIAEDRAFSRLLIDDATMGGMNGSYFWKEDSLHSGNFILSNGSIPKTEGLAIRYQLSPATLTHHMIVVERQTLYRLNWHNHVVETTFFGTKELQDDVDWLSVNQANGDVWLVDNLGDIYSISLPWATSSFTQVANHGRKAASVEVDGARHRFWNICYLTNRIYLTDFDGTDIASAATTYPVQGVTKMYVSPHTGDLFAVLPSNSAPLGSYLMHVNSAGTATSNNAYAISDVSPWGTNSILFVAGDNKVYQYANGSVTTLFTAGSLNQACSVHGKLGEVVYVVDTTLGTLFRFSPSGTPLWSWYLLGTSPRIWADFDLVVSAPGHRPIRFWMDSKVGTLLEEQSSRSVTSTVNIPGGGSLHTAFLTSLQPQQVWSKIETITSPIIITPESSSSQSSQTSGDISSSSRFTNTSSSSSSSSEVDYLKTKNSVLWNYWSLDQSASPWTDVIHANNLARNSGTIQSDVNAKRGMRLHFINASALIYTYGTFQPTTSGSGIAISLWLDNPTTAACSLYNGSAFSLSCAPNTTWSSTLNSIVFTVRQSNSTALQTHTLQPAGFNHIVAIAADGVVELYLNGDLVDSKTFNNTFASFSYMGFSAAAGTYCWLDEVAYWKNITFGSKSNRNKFVGALYNYGTGHFYTGGNWV